MKGRRVLIVDDETAVADFVRTVVELEGGAVVLAATAAHALSCFRTEGPFDLMILDLALPDLSGWELIEKARGLFHGCKVVVFSAQHPDKDADHILMRDVALRLVKPVAAAALRDALRIVLPPLAPAPPPAPGR